MTTITTATQDTIPTLFLLFKNYETIDFVYDLLFWNAVSYKPDGTLNFQVPVGLFY
jgi:hypothetical protein